MTPRKRTALLSQAGKEMGQTAHLLKPKVANRNAAQLVRHGHPRAEAAVWLEGRRLQSHAKKLRQLRGRFHPTEAPQLSSPGGGLLSTRLSAAHTYQAARGTQASCWVRPSLPLSAKPSLRIRRKGCRSVLGLGTTLLPKCR